MSYILINLLFLYINLSFKFTEFSLIYFNLYKFTKKAWIEHLQLQNKKEEGAGRCPFFLSVSFAVLLPAPLFLRLLRLQLSFSFSSTSSTSFFAPFYHKYLGSLSVLSWLLFAVSP